MKILHWIVVGLLAIIILGIIFWPKPHDSNKAQYLDTLSFLRAKEAYIIAQGQRIIKTYEDRVRTDSVKLAAKDEQIRQAKARVVIKRIPVQPLIDSIPELKAFIQGQDSLIEIMQQAIDTLKISRDFQIRVTEDLIQNHNAEESIEARIDLEQTERIADLEKQVRKQRRGNKLLKVGVIVLPVAALIFGSQL